MIVVERPRLEASPRDGCAWRLSARVRYPGGGAERYWIDGPGDSTGVDRSGTPWAVALAPLAVTLGRPLRVEGGADPTVRAGLLRVARTWRGWYPDLGPLDLETEAASTTGGSRTGAMFSGGVDSLFTLLSHPARAAAATAAPDASPPETAGGSVGIDDLLTVHGFDIPLGERASFARMVERFRGLAADRGTELRPYATNLRETRWARAAWGRLAHGCALAAVALADGGRYGRVLVAATGGDRDPHPWGSHADTDPLLSSSGTRLVHDGGHATRVEKVRAVAADRGALEVLRVCWRSGTDANCGACSKCLRTMAVLELLGALADAPTFPPGFRPDRLERVRVWESWDVREFRDLVALAREAGRSDVERAARRAMARSAVRRWGLGALDRLPSAAPLRRPLAALRSRLMADWIW